MKRILITGQDSYIGTSVEKWLMREPDKYSVHTIDMRDGSWKTHDFSQYDVVFHVAGIAHVSSDPKLEDLYYKVNRDLTIQTAAKAKDEGVSQFIFMSSIIVYGDGGTMKVIIDSNTVPNPSNFYGDSKLQAENGIKPLQTDDFNIAIIRPPMIYGRGSKGNYPRLARLAQKTPVFPDFHNERSMLHIDNLCEFIRSLIENNEAGTFFPQNSEYVRTSELVKIIAEVHGRRVRLTKLFNPFIRLFFKLSIINKVFGNQVYDKQASKYSFEYQIRNFRETIELTEV